MIEAVFPRAYIDANRSLADLDPAIHLSDSIRGYSGNPALWPLVYNTAALDVLGGQVPLAVVDLPAALQAYARARWQRNAMVQRRSQRNGVIFHASGPLRFARDIAMRAGGAAMLDSPWLYGP